MYLHYRGVDYQTTPLNLTPVEKQFIGKYRGQNCYRTTYDTHLVAQSHPRLKFRGVAYGGVAQEAPVSSKTMPNSPFKIEMPEHRKPVQSSRHQALTELDRVHNEFLLKKLEQRISSAQQNGDEGLVQKLEQEKNNLV
jgi:hypothetical protein